MHTLMIPYYILTEMKAVMKKHKIRCSEEQWDAFYNEMQKAIPRIIGERIAELVS